MKTDFALSVVFGLRHVICGFLKKGEIISIAAQNNIDPASLAVTDQLICSQGKRRLTLDYVPFYDMTFQPIFFFFYKLLLHMTHTGIFFFMEVTAPEIS